MYISEKENHNRKQNHEKLNTILFIALFVVLAMPFTVFAQNDLTVPLSRPGKAGVLEVSSIYADDVIIRAHSGQDVIVKFDGMMIRMIMTIEEMAYAESLLEVSGWK